MVVICPPQFLSGGEISSPVGVKTSFLPTKMQCSGAARRLRQQRCEKMSFPPQMNQLTRFHQRKRAPHLPLARKFENAEKKRFFERASLYYSSVLRLSIHWSPKSCGVVEFRSIKSSVCPPSLIAFPLLRRPLSFTRSLLLSRPSSRTGRSFEGFADPAFDISFPRGFFVFSVAADFIALYGSPSQVLTLDMSVFDWIWWYISKVVANYVLCFGLEALVEDIVLGGVEAHFYALGVV